MPMREFRMVVVIFTLLVITASGVCAQDRIGSGQDCTDVSVDYLDDPDLTREEKLTLMDKALFDSLNKFERCQSEKNSASASAASGGGGGGTGQGGGAGQGNENSSSEEGSVASSGISGSEAPKDPQKADDVANMENDASGTAQEANEQTGRTDDGSLNQSGGKLPDDIPPAENDDVLAAQIRYAAENEKDPKKKAQLWDEYRKYKGLPTKG
jgi:hypothetical protein